MMGGMSCEVNDSELSTRAHRTDSNLDMKGNQAVPSIQPLYWCVDLDTRARIEHAGRYCRSHYVRLHR